MRTVYLEIAAGYPNWIGVEPELVGQLAILIARSKGGTKLWGSGTFDFHRSYIRPTMQEVIWPRLAKSLRLG